MLRVRNTSQSNIKRWVLAFLRSLRTSKNTPIWSFFPNYLIMMKRKNYRVLKQEKLLIEIKSRYLNKSDKILLAPANITMTNKI